MTKSAGRWERSLTAATGKKDVNVMKKYALFPLIAIAALAAGVSAFGANAGAEGRKVKIAAGDISVVVTLNGSKAAADLASLLPVTTTLVERSNFAKSMRLPRELKTDEPTTRQYELGSLNYWANGPSVSIVYNAYLDETIVPVVPIGKAGDAAKALARATGPVTLTLLP